MTDLEPEKLQQAFGGMGELLMPGEAQTPILGKAVRAALHQWLFEINASEELSAVGLKPRTRCLLSGPPGCGKTTLAHHICARLGIPILVVQSHEIIGPYLGESGGRLGKLFKSLRRQSQEVGLFFDEFDAMAKSRADLGSQGADNERTNITIALLQEFDRYGGMIFAATNQAQIIDPAIWRRFNMQIEIGFPGPEERFAIVKLYLAPYLAEDETVLALANVFDGASPALIREGCEAIKRSLVLGPKIGLPTDLPSILTRFSASSSPAEGQPVPPLWQDPRGAAQKAKAAAWPPALETKG